MSISLFVFLQHLAQVYTCQVRNEDGIRIDLPEFNTENDTVADMKEMLKERLEPRVLNSENIRIVKGTKTLPDEAKVQEDDILMFDFVCSREYGPYVYRVEMICDDYVSETVEIALNEELSKDTLLKLLKNKFVFEQTIEYGDRDKPYLGLEIRSIEGPSLNTLVLNQMTAYRTQPIDELIVLVTLVLKPGVWEGEL